MVQWKRKRFPFVTSRFQLDSNGFHCFLCLVFFLDGLSRVLPGFSTGLRPSQPAGVPLRDRLLLAAAKQKDHDYRSLAVFHSAVIHRTHTFLLPR